MANIRKMIHYHGSDGSLGKDGNSITILTYNMLAPHLSATNWDDRKSKLLEELKFYNADVMCLQEVVDEDVTGYFGPRLLEHGYDFIINTERNDMFFGPGKEFKMGCAIFYKTSSFRVDKDFLYKINFRRAARQFLKERNLEKLDGAFTYLREKAGIGCMLEFRPKKKNIMIFIVTVHLTAKEKLSDVKLLQTYLLLKGLSIIEAANIPIIVAGDFNILPKSAPYMMITNRQMPKPEKDKTATTDKTAATDKTVATDEKPGINICLFLDLPMAAPLESAYSTILKPGSGQGLKECKRMKMKTMEPIFTTVSENFKDTTDYIFYTKEEFSVEGILELIDDVEELPTEVWPSDHIGLMACVQLKKKRKMDDVLIELLKTPVDEIWNKRDENSPVSSNKENESSSNSKDAADQECETSTGKQPVNEECETSTSKEATEY